MFSAPLYRRHESLEDNPLFRVVSDYEELAQAETVDIDYAPVTSSSTDRRANVRQNEIDLDKLNGTFRAGRSGKRNSGVNRCDKVDSRARNAFFRNASMRRACGLT